MSLANRISACFVLPCPITVELFKQDPAILALPPAISNVAGGVAKQSPKGFAIDDALRG
jgi:hypothetical protein